MAQHDTHHWVSGRRDGPTILLEFQTDFSADWPKVIIERARDLHWRLLDLRFRNGLLPEGVVPQGAIVSRLPDDPLVRQLLKQGCSVVRLGSQPHPRDRLVPAVMPDWQAGGRLAAEHFAERGFKHFGYIGHHRPLADRQKLQYDGLQEGAAKRGCQCHLLELKHLVARDPGDQYRERRAVITEWLKAVPKPLGLMAFVDGFAATLCEMCRDTGLAVPEEVAILGWGNIPSACVCTRPTLSSIVPDDVKRAETAVNLLQQLLEGGKPAESTVVIPPSGIVVRESTDVLAVAERTVAAALRYVWDHLDLDVSVTDVAREVGVSRRALERLFRTHLGRGVNAERHRKRMEVFAHLLRVRDEPIADLAPRVGFRTMVYLHKSFRRAHGMTPRQYRKAEGGRRNAESRSQPGYEGSQIG